MYASFPYVYIEETDDVITLVVHLSNDLHGQHETSMFGATLVPPNTQGDTGC